MRYQFIKERQGLHRVSVLCRVMQVGRGSYYAWLNREPSPRQQADAALSQKIVKVFEESGQTYGSPAFSMNSKRKESPVVRNGWLA